MKKLLLVLILMGTMISGSFAAPKGSGPFYLDGATVEPQQTWEMRLDSLAPATEGKVLYDVTCYIENTNYQKDYPVVMQIKTYAPSMAFNGRLVKYHSQVVLDKLINVFSLWGVDSALTYADSGFDSKPWIISSVLELKNLDRSNAVKIKQCVAVYSIS